MRLSTRRGRRAGRGSRVRTCPATGQTTATILVTHNRCSYPAVRCRAGQGTVRSGPATEPWAGVRHDVSGRLALALPRPVHRRRGRRGRVRRRPAAGHPAAGLPAGDLPLAASRDTAAVVLAGPARGAPARRAAGGPLAAPAA